ncbi:hypothetical protein SDRG_11816 [Saprolegnia diclina VS20]|uniref:Uncharacterized protein n=1 Tax=Saprolegnia diclina (strain VS20) TaxID=1156394 RepID=T0QAH9_SAPDV|nr:hypothetical protein SDRG_11816 [Saprolegnia diclina VS20]EQC30500.1 hypothetical protein SDRG_11816 [Saprolegnia diclina VS20]|eukprot:XP_008616093.1 hypothetical protein SDRG_11816 [Saprolegnia diclina VS20]
MRDANLRADAVVWRRIEGGVGRMDTCTTVVCRKDVQRSASQRKVLSVLGFDGRAQHNPKRLRHSSKRDVDASMLVPTCFFNGCTNPRLPMSVKCDFHKHRLQCLDDGCHNQVYARHRCVRHGGKLRCAHPTCDRNVRLGAFCSSHGQSTAKRHCSEPGCTTQAHARGLCVRHGGGRPCAAPGCPLHARTRGFCARHARHTNNPNNNSSSSINNISNIAQLPVTPPPRLPPTPTVLPTIEPRRKPCIIHGCLRRAHARQRCVRHGGGRLCAVPDCTSHARTGGVCCRHAQERPTLSTTDTKSLALWPRPTLGLRSPVTVVDVPAVLRVEYRGQASLDWLEPFESSSSFGFVDPMTDIGSMILPDLELELLDFTSALTY